LGINLHDVAIVYEATVFGGEFCRSYNEPRRDQDQANSSQRLCEAALKIPFPVNIADVRYGVREKQAARRVEAEKALHIPQGNNTLGLEDGAENGSEFPESQQSTLTAVGTQMILRNIQEQLKRRKAQLVVVVATDVRDRLLLFEQISAVDSKALLIDLGTDLLVGHPGFINATRGLLTLGSSALEGCWAVKTYDAPCGPDSDGVTLTWWSTDDQALTAEAIEQWATSKGEPGVTKDLRPYVVTRRGLITGKAVTADDGDSWIQTWPAMRWTLVAVAFVAHCAALLKIKSSKAGRCVYDDQRCRVVEEVA
jgi:hypothetical protein